MAGCLHFLLYFTCANGRTVATDAEKAEVMAAFKCSTSKVSSNARTARNVSNYKLGGNNMAVEFVYIENDVVVKRDKWNNFKALYKADPGTKAEKWVYESGNNRTVIALYSDDQKVYGYDQCHVAFNGWREIHAHNLPPILRMESLLGVG